MGFLKLPTQRLIRATYNRNRGRLPYHVYVGVWNAKTGKPVCSMTGPCGQPFARRAAMMVLAPPKQRVKVYKKKSKPRRNSP